MRAIALLFACSAVVAGCKTSSSSNPTAMSGSDQIREERRGDEVITQYDLNRDKRPDVWKFSKRDRDGKDTVIRKEKDLNGDGKVDLWETYNEDGTVPKVIWDMDFDGRPDVTAYYEKGQLVKKEYDLDFDKRFDVWKYYENNKLVRQERDTNGDGRVDYWEYWENNEIDRIGTDTDGDGQVDKWETRKKEAGAAGGSGT